MSQIKQEVGWTTFDKLDGVRLVRDDVLLVSWPDGSREKVVVSIHYKRESLDFYNANTRDVVVQPDGRSAKMREFYSAHAKISYHGLILSVPLLGLEAERVKRKK